MICKELAECGAERDGDLAQGGAEVLTALTEEGVSTFLGGVRPQVLVEAELLAGVAEQREDRSGDALAKI